MPTAAEAAAQALANTATYGGAVNAGGLVSLQVAGDTIGAASGVGGLLGVDPASILFSLALRAMGIGPSGTQATPMNPQEQALFEAGQKVAMATQMTQAGGYSMQEGGGEGQDAMLFEAINSVLSLPDDGMEFYGKSKEALLNDLARAEADGIYNGTAADRGLAETLQLMKAFPAATDYNFYEETPVNTTTASTNALDAASSAAIASTVQQQQHQTLLARLLTQA